MEESVIEMVREAMKRVTGTNCTFVDDDVKALAILADVAIQYGLAEHARIPESMKKRIEDHLGLSTPA